MILLADKRGAARVETMNGRGVRWRCEEQTAADEHVAGASARKKGSGVSDFGDENQSTVMRLGRGIKFVAHCFGFGFIRSRPIGPGRRGNERIADGTLAVKTYAIKHYVQLK